MKTIMSLTTASVLAISAGTAFAEGSITAVSWGGAYTKSQVEAYHKPWTAATGNTVVSEDYSGGLAEVKAQVDSGSVTWDIIDVEKSDAVRGCDEGLFMEIDHSTLPNGADGSALLMTLFLDHSQIARSQNRVVNNFRIDSSVMANGPTSIADFFNLDAFPGKRGLRKSPKANLEMALAADGVASADIYEVLGTDEGVDRAFAKLDTIKDSVVWWEAGAQPPQLLADGEVAMTTAYNGRIFNAVASEGKPFEIVWDAQVFDVDMWAIVNGAPNAELAMDFLKFSTATEQLAAQASYISYGPARKSSAPLVGTYHSNASLEMGHRCQLHQITSQQRFQMILNSGQTTKTS